MENFDNDVSNSDDDIADESAAASSTRKNLLLAQMYDEKVQVEEGTNTEDLTFDTIKMQRIGEGTDSNLQALKEMDDAVEKLKLWREKSENKGNFRGVEAMDNKANEVPSSWIGDMKRLMEQTETELHDIHQVDTCKSEYLQTLTTELEASRGERSTHHGGHEAKLRARLQQQEDLLERRRAGEHALPATESTDTEVEPFTIFRVGNTPHPAPNSTAEKPYLQTGGSSIELPVIENAELYKLLSDELARSDERTDGLLRERMELSTGLDALGDQLCSFVDELDSLFPEEATSPKVSKDDCDRRDRGHK